MGSSDGVPRRCLGCGYDLAGLGRGVCPECGLAVGAYEEAIAAERAAYLGRFRRGQRGWLSKIAGVVVVYSGGAGALAMDWGVVRSAAVVLVALIAGSVLVAWPILRLARPADRRVALVVWARTNWWLHVPWLVVGPAAAVTLVLALLDAWLIGIGYAFPVGIGVIGFVLVPSLVLVCWLVHIDETKRINGELGVRLGAAKWLLPVAAAVVVLVSGAVGIRGSQIVLTQMDRHFGWSE